MAFDAQQGRRSRLEDLIIPNGTDVSNFLNSDQYEQYTHLAVLAPAVLTNACSPEANIDPSADETLDAQWKAYHPLTAGTAVTFPADTITIIPSAPTHGFRIKSAANEGAERTFRIWGIIIPR